MSRNCKVLEIERPLLCKFYHRKIKKQPLFIVFFEFFRDDYVWFPLVFPGLADVILAGLLADSGLIWC